MGLHDHIKWSNKITMEVPNLITAVNVKMLKLKSAISQHLTTIVTLNNNHYNHNSVVRVILLFLIILTISIKKFKKNCRV